MKPKLHGVDLTAWQPVTIAATCFSTHVVEMPSGEQLLLFLCFCSSDNCCSFRWCWFTKQVSHSGWLAEGASVLSQTGILLRWNLQKSMDEIWTTDPKKWHTLANWTTLVISWPATFVSLLTHNKHCNGIFASIFSTKKWWEVSPHAHDAAQKWHVMTTAPCSQLWQWFLHTG